MVFDLAVRSYVSWAGRHHPYAFISGDAWRGPDRLIIEWAEANNVPCFKYPADWDHLGKRAGHIRNAEMRQDLTHLLVFWDGESKGTKEMIENTMKIDGANVFIVLVQQDEWWKDYQRRKREKNPQFSTKRFKARHHEWKPQSS